MSEHAITFNPAALRAYVYSIKVGNVYKAKGGKGDTSMWLVAAVRGESVHLLGLREDGEVVSTATYGAHALKERELIGRCDMAAFDFPIKPIP